MLNSNEGPKIKSTPEEITKKFTKEFRRNFLLEKFSPSNTRQSLAIQEYEQVCSANEDENKKLHNEILILFYEYYLNKLSPEEKVSVERLAESRDERAKFEEIKTLSQEELASKLEETNKE